MIVRRELVGVVLRKSSGFATSIKMANDEFSKREKSLDEKEFQVFRLCVGKDRLGVVQGTR